MKNNRYNFLRGVLCIALICVLALSFSSCKNDEYSEMDSRVEKLIEHTVAGNSQGVREYMADVRTDGEIDRIFPQMHQTLSGVKHYSVQRVEAEENQSEGTGKIVATYFVYSLNLEVYEVKVAQVDGYDGFVGYTVKKILAKDSENLAPIFDQIIFLIYTLGCMAFCVKMIIDCARRQIGKNRKTVKALIMLGIICGGLCVFTYGSGGFNFKFFPSLFLSFSEEIGVKGLTQVRLFLPIGGIIYFIVRKRFPMSERANKKSKNTSEQEQTETDAAEQTEQVLLGDTEETSLKKEVSDTADTEIDEKQKSEE